MLFFLMCNKRKRNFVVKCSKIQAFCVPQCKDLLIKDNPLDRADEKISICCLSEIENGIKSTGHTKMRNYLKPVETT